jgi:PAS domain S-box-containing protein
VIPRQPDELKPAELSSALNAIVWVVLATIPIELGAVLLAPDYSTRWFAILGAVYGICALALLLSRRGRPRIGGLLAVAGLWVIVTISTVTAGGTYAIAPWFYVIVVLITGLFFGPRAGAGIALASGAALLVIALLQEGGWLQWPVLAYSPLLRWLGLAMVLAMMTGLQWFAANRIGSATRRSEKLIENIDGIVWEADATTLHATFVSPQAEQLLGYPCAQWLAEPTFWSDHIHPDDRKSAVAFCLACAAELRAHEFEYRMVAADGRHVWIRDLVAVEAQAGRARTLRGIMTDITARKTSEVLLRESEERYRTLAETATDAILTIDPTFRILFANAAAERMFGYAGRLLIGMQLPALMPERVRESFDLSFQQYLSTGAQNRAGNPREMTGLHHDGRELFLEVAFSELRIGGQQLFTGIIRDISERRNTENALRSTERRFAIAFNANPTPSTISTLDGRFLDANEQFLRTAGFAREEVVGRTALELGLWPNPEDRSELMRRLRDDGFVRGFEAHMRTKTGARRVLNLSVERIELDGQPCLLHSGQDITLRKLAENALRESEARLRALSARLESAREEEGRRIAREIHDELGGTLTTLKWNLDGMAERLSSPPSPAEVDRIRKSVPMMVDLVESTMMTVRRIASDLRPSVLDELGVVAAIEWQVRRFETSTGIPCTFEADPDAPELDRDRATAVFRILQEILTNVLRHAKASQVHVAIGQMGGNFILDVRDDGRGIAQDEMVAARSLGLLGMRERALLVGGEVKIQGVPGRGTSVVVTIPLREAVAAAVAPA